MPPADRGRRPLLKARTSGTATLDMLKLKYASVVLRSAIGDYYESDSGTAGDSYLPKILSFARPRSPDPSASCDGGSCRSEG